jgi:hypothetical protein
MRPNGTTARTLTLALLVVMLASGCQYRFGIVGDSVTQDSRDELEAHHAYVRAFGGVDIRAGRASLQQMARDRLPVVVSAVGSFDVAFGASPAALQRRLRHAMADTASVDCVIWLEQNENPNVHADWPARASQFNNILHRVAANHGVLVAPWSELAAQHPNAWFRSDGIHLRPRGQRGYAAFINRFVQQHC